MELCCLEAFPSHLSLLDVLIQESHLGSVFQTDTDPPTALFTPHRSQGPDKLRILLRLHATTEEETAGSGGRVRLFASRFFLRHHGFQLHGCTGTVRALEPVRLDRVVIGARSRQSLRWAGSEHFTGGLLDLCRPGQWLLARQGDPLLLPRHLLLGAEPAQVRTRPDRNRWSVRRSLHVLRSDTTCVFLL